MVELKDQSAHYDVNESAGSGTGYEIFRAREKSTGAQCFFHRITVEKGVKETEVQSAVAVLRRYGQLTYARTPRVGDAWMGDGFLAAVEFKEEARPLDPQSNNPFIMPEVFTPQKVVESTLSLLCALHFHGIVNGNLTAASYGIGPLNKVYLIDSGIDRSLVNSFNKANDDMFMLSTNLLGHDVAQWALMIITLMMRGSLSESSLDDKWDEMHFTRVRDRISRLFPQQELLQFFMDCLTGFGVNDPKFDSATDAMRKWYDQELWGMWP
ncbi:hypothetical protein IT570_04955 [Candidatus Sumerlaeota bacterium]|nr:hypothetical protein [Candidatus Sumerlaeota bacterium]